MTLALVRPLQNSITHGCNTWAARCGQLFLALLVSVPILMLATTVRAAILHATVNSINTKGVGASIGTVTFEDTKWGLLVEPDLSSLPPGIHGFHIHQNGACGPAAQQDKMVAGLAAGGHYDPQHTGKHLGPYNNEGHEGDLPPLLVNAAGEAALPVLAPRLMVKDLKGRSVVIHAGEDNYSDQPQPLGGGGTRIACGIIR